MFLHRLKQFDFVVDFRGEFFRVLGKALARCLGKPSEDFAIDRSDTAADDSEPERIG